jgi:hypothetical protein
VTHLDDLATTNEEPASPWDTAAVPAPSAAADDEFLGPQIGPRKEGGTYYNGYWGQEYTVTRIERRPVGYIGRWRITVRWADGHTTSHCTGWDPKRDRVVAEPPVPDVTIVSVGRLHDDKDSAYATVLQNATIALDLRRHFRDPHIRADLRELTAHDQAVRDTVINTPGIRQVLAATVLQIDGYLAGPTAAPMTVVTQCAGGRHRAAATAMALHAVVSGDIAKAAEYGLQDSAKAFEGRGLVVELVHRDLDRDVVER